MNLASIVAAAFGGAWFYYGAVLLMPQYGTGALVCSILLAAAFASLAFFGRNARAQAASKDTVDATRKRRSFFIVLIAELVLINVAWSVFQRSHHPEYLVAAIAVVVGLHFVPLARIYREPVFYIPAAGMTAAGILAVVPSLSAVACFGCAGALWTAVAVSAARRRNAGLMDSEEFAAP